MLCPNCETENRESAKFCDECGFPLAAIAATSRQQKVHDERAPESGPEPAPDKPVVSELDRTQEITIDEEARAGDGSAALDDASATEDRPAVVEPTAIEDYPPVDEPATVEDYPPSDEPATVEGDTMDDDAASGADSRVDGSLPEVKAETADASNDDKPATVDRAGISADETAQLNYDLTGFDKTSDEYGERLVDESYEPPKIDWRDGGTMQMPRIEGSEAPKSKDYLASITTKQNKTGKKVVVAVVVIAILAAAIAFLTYHAEMWGGKAVPDVKGQTEADARNVLESEGFAVKATQVKSDDTEGLVLIMDPDSGTRMPEGSEVVIHIATARTVPNVVGKSKDEAQKAIAAEGCEYVTYKTEYSDEDEGKVLDVSPAPGTRVKSTAEIVVTVAEPRTVPDVSNMYLNDAIKAIQDMGLGYDIAYVQTESYADGTLLGTVPAAGEKVKEGTVVILQIAQARGAQLEELVRSQLAPGSQVTLNGTNYLIESLDSVTYMGNDTVAYTATGRAFTYLLGETLFASASQSISGTITFTADNQIASST